MMSDFIGRILDVQAKPLARNGIDVFQVNLGYRCNMACSHCHLYGGRGRTQEMGRDTVETVLQILKENEIGVLDITGGAPELNRHFRHLVQEAGSSGSHVIVRTNLTVFLEEGLRDLTEFYSDNRIEVIASLPHYSESDVDRIRGNGAFQKSIRALKILNSLGYGKDATGKVLNLVHNPAGAFLPPPQTTLEQDYRLELSKRFGISFNNLYVFTNAPVGRFRDHLIITNRLNEYIGRLAAAFNPGTLEGLMCRHMISVGWDGRIYDCDFNQALGLSVDSDSPQHIGGFDLPRFTGRKINVGDHCYACTAGQGST